MHGRKVMRVFRYKAYMMIYMRCKGDLGTGQDHGCPKVRLEVLLKTLTRHPSFWDIPGMFEAWDIHQTFSENNQRTSHKGKERYRGVIPRVSNLDIHRTFHLSGGVALTNEV